MSDVIELSGKRPPVVYTVRISQHWNGTLEFFVEDVADDQRSRESIAWALRKMADCLDSPTGGGHTLKSESQANKQDAAILIMARYLEPGFKADVLSDRTVSDDSAVGVVREAIKKAQE